MTDYTIALLVGSTRTGSINQKLARAIKLSAPANLHFIPVSMEEMPWYNGDLEGKRPAEVNAFTKAIRECDGVCIVTPEYNRSIPGVLKNAVDWGSKPPAENIWRDKVIAMTGASPGGIGTAVGQQHLRQILAIQGAIVMPGEVYITFKSPTMIGDDGQMDDETLSGFIADFGARMEKLVGKMTAS
ncbi:MULTISPECIES: NADPH-dependent FMN reductase [Falsihalocynthiibacter]|jgi:chromate reductase|uniref:NADPH-dependent FMN reductase n=1 Tax=Falsihalocynthiibacter TaxID=2854182 RepID=UPI003002707F